MWRREVLELLDQINGVVSAPITLWLLGLTGLYLMVGLRFMPLRRIGFGMCQTLASICSTQGEGDGSAFDSLTTALVATIGTGNVAGLAGAITLGGPRAVFWMRLIALVGMPTKDAESLLAVHSREVDALGEHVGILSPSSAPWPVSALATACRPMRWPWRSTKLRGHLNWPPLW